MDNPTIEISEAARRLKALREQSGLSMRAVAEALGWALTRYQHYEDRYKRPFLPADLAYALAEIFKAEGVDPASVLELAGIGAAPAASAGGSLPPRPVPLAPSSGPVRDLPVLGAVKGGSEGFYFNEGEPKEFLLRPANLAGATDAFALYVYGDSMEPRYFAGEILYVNPNRPLTRNCFVAVELGDGQGMIKQFVSRSDDYVLLRQFNPPKDIRLPAREVRRIYRITGSGEPG